MQQQKSLTRVLYAYISFAFFCVFLNIIGVFPPLPDIMAAIALLSAAYYVGKYGNIRTKKRR